MSIWTTRNPDPTEFPIWAYMDDSNDLVLLREKDYDSVKDRGVTWKRARVDTPDHIDSVGQEGL